MAKLWSDWLDDVVPYAPGVPVGIAEQKIREAAIRFFKGSRVWHYLGLTAVDAVAAQQRYPLSSDPAQGTVPANTVVAHVYQANYSGMKLDVLTLEQFKGQSDTWFSDPGDPESLTMFAESEIALYEVPDTGLAGAIVLPDVALAPSQASAGISDDGLYEKWRDVIALGAKALIYQIPKKPYSDPANGAVMMQDFQSEIGAANARAASGRGIARLRSRTLYRGGGEK